MAGHVALYNPSDGASGGVAAVNLGGREVNDLVRRDVRMGSVGNLRVVFRCSSPQARTFFCEAGGVETEIALRPMKGAFAEVACELHFAAGIQKARLFNPSSPTGFRVLADRRNAQLSDRLLHPYPTFLSASFFTLSPH